MTSYDTPPQGDNQQPAKTPATVRNGAIQFGDESSMSIAYRELTGKLDASQHWGYNSRDSDNHDGVSMSLAVKLYLDGGVLKDFRKPEIRKEMYASLYEDYAGLDSAPFGRSQSLTDAALVIAKRAEQIEAAKAAGKTSLPAIHGATEAHALYTAAIQQGEKSYLSNDHETQAELKARIRAGNGTEKLTTGYEQWLIQEQRIEAKNDPHNFQHPRDAVIIAGVQELKSQAHVKHTELHDAHPPVEMPKVPLSATKGKDANAR